MFICFEGIDGSGKTTQVRLLKDYLERLGYEVWTPRDPGTTEAGERIRKILLDKDTPLSPHAQHLLFAASRCELALRIQQRLQADTAHNLCVIVDRWLPSTLAYQGTQGVDPEFIKQVARVTCGHVHPDMTFILELPVEAAAERLKDKQPDRFESFDVEAVRKRRLMYLTTQHCIGHFRVLDATCFPEAVHTDVVRLVREHFTLRHFHPDETRQHA